MNEDALFIATRVGIALLGIFILILLCYLATRAETNSENRHVFIPRQLQYSESTYNNDELNTGKNELLQRIRVWLETNTPQINKTNLTSIEITPELVLIRDRGILAFRFDEWTPDLTVDERTPLLDQRRAPYFINDSLEIEFNSSNEEMSSTVMNLPIPVQNRRNDTTYFEVKIMSFTNEVSFGLTTLPYANWCLPGILPYSFSINNKGQLISNSSPFETEPPQLFPTLQRGDIIGIGVRFTTGSVFVSHNGRNSMEIIKGIKFDVYPEIGARGKAKLSVNIGQMGFLLVEANVKKWGFCENQNEGQLGAPPLYGSQMGDVVLDKGEEMPPKYPEQGFFDP